MYMYDGVCIVGWLFWRLLSLVEIPVVQLCQKQTDSSGIWDQYVYSNLNFIYW